MNIRAQTSKYSVYLINSVYLMYFDQNGWSTINVQ